MESFIVWTQNLGDTCNILALVNLNSSTFLVYIVIAYIVLSTYLQTAVIASIAIGNSSLVHHMVAMDGI